MPHDEFSSLEDVAREVGRRPEDVPPVRRVSHGLPDGGSVSALWWGDRSPEVVFLHGGGQNAHTWDLVAVDLGRPALALDLPGHGHSSWRADRDYWPERNAEAVAATLAALAPAASVVVGMSLGGLTAIRLAASRPDLVRSLVLVDITPRPADASAGYTAAQRGTTALLRGRRSFTDVEALVDAAAAASPRRLRDSVRRGVLHNVVADSEGAWRWRHDFVPPDLDPAAPDLGRLWDDVSALEMPVLLVRGGDSVHVIAEQVAELRRRVPDARVVTVPDAGHAVQSDQPRALARLIADVLG